METTLQQIFTEEYNREAFDKEVLRPIFQKSVKDFIIYEEGGEQQIELTETDKRSAKKALKYGEFKTYDDRKIELYEITVEDFKQVKIARVGLGALVKKLIIGNNAVFATFKYENTIERHWRFSFIAYDSFFKDGQVQTKETSPKRYTYVFGDKDETYRTAIDRFQKLNDKFQIKLEDIQEAFAVEAMSKEFFDEYRETHYAKFIRHLTGDVFEKKGNKHVLVEKEKPKHGFLDSVFDGNKKDARDFCKKLLGQIVFIYFLQKKGWMAPLSGDFQKADGDKYFLQNLYEQSGENDNFYPKWLSKLFYETLNKKRSDDNFTMPDGSNVKIPYLNGGLFDKESDKFDHLVFPSKLFADLFEFFNRFNFTIYENSPEERTVAVDPEMLGHIFENLLEDNKDKGAFYTPKEIVQYMTQESLIEYLVTHVGGEINKGINQFVKQKNKESLTNKQLKEIDDLLDNVKICDPAIGSGAFPMGLLQEIYALKERIAFDLGKGWDPATVKENIIQNSIYGVDIEKGAVDVAQLRFWLSLIVDEEAPKPLPNLAYKIVAGNSLISKFGDKIIEIDWDKKSSVGKADEHIKKMQNALQLISTKQKDYFESKILEEKNQLKSDIRELKLTVLLNQILFNKEAYLNKNQKFLDMGFGLKAKDLKKNKEIDEQIEEFDKTILIIKELINNPEQPFEHFDWRLDFPELLNPIINQDYSKRGFDIVIGNPPYIKEYTNKKAFDGFRNSDYYKGKMDLWYGFACISIDLLKEKGVECFIAQNNWITSAGASKFRNKVLKETKIKLFTDFWNYKVFKSAGIQTMIYLLKKEVPNSPYPLRYSLLKDDTIKESELEHFLNFKNDSGVDEKYTLDFDSTLYYNSLITFNNPKIDNILKFILDNEVEFLNSDEIAQGIVYPQDKLNQKNADKLGEGFNVNDGVFQVNEQELSNLNLNTEEDQLIKPIYSTSELHRYYGDKKNKEWIIYTKSNIKNTIESYPNIKKHLDKYSSIITSDNKPYGLHRARNENFFKGKKIISLRKSNEPCFTYTDFDCYVTQTFYSLKTKRFNLKYLTCLLNSKLIAFWLRFKGKMQGNNYQIDKGPLINIPIINTGNIKPFTILADYLIFLHNPNTPQANSFAKNKSIAKAFEDLVDMMVYELYFEQHMLDLKIDVIQFIDTEKIFNPISELKDDKLKAEIIGKCYTWLNKEDNPIRNRILLSNIHSKEIIALINSNTL